MAETRWATAADGPALEAFLRAHRDHAMFALSNLRAHGAVGGAAPEATRFRLTLARGAIRGVIGISSGGGLLPVGDPELEAPAFAGAPLSELLGEAHLAQALLGAFGLEAAPVTVNRDEPHFALDLADLILSEARGLRLTPLRAAPRAQMEAWRSAYAAEILGEGPDAAAARGPRDIAAFLRADSHRVLWRGDQPVAMTGFNAALPEIVQVGGVFTPPALRGQGLARAAVGLHLAQARGAGVGRAVLFAASDMAARAYIALGFRRIGAYRMCLFDGPCRVEPVPGLAPSLL